MVEMFEDGKKLKVGSHSRSIRKNFTEDGLEKYCAMIQAGIKSKEGGV